MARRTFLHAGILGGLGAQLVGTPASASATGCTAVQQALDVPLAGAFDVIVAGAGPAGVAAAIAAARSGASVLLVEKNGCLGGIWTSGLLCWILDSNNKEGVLREIRTRLESQSAGFANRGGNGAFAYDPEAMKILLEAMCCDAGVTVRLGTWGVGGLVDDQRLTHLITESKSGREAWAAGILIDCTGDGDLAARSGCGYDFGEEGSGAAQPMTLLALVGGVPLDTIRPFVRIEGGMDSKRRLLAEIERAGIQPSYTRPGLYPIRDELYMLMANHQYGASALDANDLTRATLEARREVYEIVTGLRSLGAPWDGLRLVATAEQIGVREGRRIHGLYRVTNDDLLRGARHDDAVCRVTFGVDVHSTSKEDDHQGHSYGRGIKSRDYDIPLRALIAKDVDGLMMAGRCISGDFIAHSSYRVTGNAVAMGEAAGKAAARAAAAGASLHDKPIRQLIDPV